MCRISERRADGSHVLWGRQLLKNNSHHRKLGITCCLNTSLNLIMVHRVQNICIKYNKIETKNTNIKT